jgi:hypothetical protein
MRDEYFLLWHSQVFCKSLDAWKLDIAASMVYAHFLVKLSRSPAPLGSFCHLFLIKSSDLEEEDCKRRN